MPPRTNDGSYLYRGCSIRHTTAGWEVRTPGGTLAGTTASVRQAYQLISQHPDALPPADKRTAGSQGGKRFWEKYRIIPWKLNDFLIVSRETGETVGSMNGYHLPAR